MEGMAAYSRPPLTIVNHKPSQETGPIEFASVCSKDQRHSLFSVCRFEDLTVADLQELHKSESTLLPLGVSLTSQP